MTDPDTLVFIPAWNEEANLPAVLDELHAELPECAVLVVDDGSTDGTAAVAAAHGAEVLSFGENRGLREGIAAGYAFADERGYEFVGRVDADGQHPVDELARLIALVRSGAGRRRRRLAIRDGRGLRGVPVRAVREQAGRNVGPPSRDAPRSRPSVPRRDERDVRREPQCDARSSASRTRAAHRRSSRCSGFATPACDVVEVPVHMRERASGESKLRGSKALKLVVTVASTLLLYGVWRRLRRSS